METASDKPAGRRKRTCVRYVLPTGTGEEWLFDVPVALARCVGSYALIKEFSRPDHILYRIPQND